MTSKFLPFLLMIIGLCVTKSNAQDLEQLKDKKNIFTLSGNLNLSGGTYNYWGANNPRNLPYLWNINGGISIGIAGIYFPFSFNIGSQQRSFTQPFNRFGVRPYYKWITLHAGYSNMQFSQFVLAGNTFLGGGIELNPKGFRFAALYGRFNKATVNDTSGTFFPQSVYDRWGYGAKIGVGNNINYFDVMFFKAKDDTTSLKITGKPVLTPSENLVVGIASRIAFLKRMSFDIDVSGSLMTTNIAASDIDQIPTWYRLGKFYTPNLSSSLLFAGQTSLSYSDKFFSLRFSYRRVDPNYKSLGSFYQQGDLESYTIEPGLRLLKSKVRLSGSIGLQNDNIYRRKSFTSKRTIGSVVLNCMISKVYSFDFNFSNYGITQNQGTAVLNDTFRIAQNNKTFGLNQRLVFSNNERYITVSLSGTYQDLVDLNPLSPYNYESNNFYANLNISWYKIKSRFQLSGGFNYNKSSFSIGSYVVAGPQISVSKTFFKDKFSVNESVTYNFSLQNNNPGNIWNSNTGFSYAVTKTHSFQLTLQFLRNTTQSVDSNNFSELRVMGGYRLNFNYKKKEKNTNP